MKTFGGPLAVPGHDAEGIERATVSAVSPEAVEELDGWLLAFDSGSVKSCQKCCAPGARGV